MARNEAQVVACLVNLNEDASLGEIRTESGRKQVVSHAMAIRAGEEIVLFGLYLRPAGRQSCFGG